MQRPQTSVRYILSLTPQSAPNNTEQSEVDYQVITGQETVLSASHNPTSFPLKTQVDKQVLVHEFVKSFVFISDQVGLLRTA